ncbi:hypothetical protein SLEP1_g9542 [Rubroshorea leprosula]|uniref:Uncharacterized protein n=1 Tax=Rubroshorea leprosula TaxID=152421 RepID=A0AAV5I593_9ROSI|nr:hypothetical protein SLEP1_g9542 [Rubroshorea leprosula]
METQPCWVRDQPRLGLSEPSRSGFRRTQLCWVRLKPSKARFGGNPALLGSRPAKVGFAGTQQGWVSTEPSFVGKAWFLFFCSSFDFHFQLLIYLEIDL